METEKKEILTMSGKTVDEAIELALRELGLGKEEVEVEVVTKGKLGFLGIRAEPARVRVTPLMSDNPAAATAITIVQKLLTGIKVSAGAILRQANNPDTGGPIIDIQGDDSGLLIGRRGETLRSLQFITNVLLNQKLPDGTRATIDIERYRERRMNSLQELASRVADRVGTTGRTVTLEPMISADRRIIHLTLADHIRVTTHSIGLGEDRQVTISPRDQEFPKESKGAI